MTEPTPNPIQELLDRLSQAVRVDPLSPRPCMVSRADLVTLLDVFPRVAACRPTPTLASVFADLESLTDDERARVFRGADDYCRECGRDETATPGGCQCWNDE